MSSGGSKTTTNTDPWAGQQPYLSEGFARAYGDVLNRPMEFFPGSTVTPWSPESQMGMDAISGRALAGSPLNAAAQGEMMKTLGGDYLSAGNPYFGAMSDRIANQVRPRVDSQFSQGRRYGSGIHGEQTARALTEGIAPLAFQNYSNERGRMMGAAQLAPKLAREDYYDMDRLMGVGGMKEQKYGEELGDQQARWDFYQNEPYNRLAQYMALIQGNYGGQGASSTTNTPNTAGTAAQLGAAALMAMMMSCSKTFKQDAEPSAPVLDGVKGLTVERWHYREEMGLGQSPHLGPYAEDFQEAFGLGDGVVIDAVDAVGVCLKAIQELTTRLEALEGRNVSR